MRGRLSLLFALLALCQPATADDLRWVEVTRPMLACEAANDDGSRKRRFLDFLESMPQAAPLPERCRRTLRAGEAYLLDPDQTEADTQEIVKLWQVSCLSGGIRLVAALYAPPRRIMGAYLRPARAPNGCEEDEGQGSPEREN